MAAPSGSPRRCAEVDADSAVQVPFAVPESDAPSELRAKVSFSKVIAPSGTESAPSQLLLPVSTPTTPDLLRAAATAQTLTSSDDCFRYQHVRWQWEHKTGWRDYQTWESDRIEAAYRRGMAYMRMKVDVRHSRSCPLEVYFWDMIQFDPVTENKRNIRVSLQSGSHAIQHYSRQVSRAYGIISYSLETGKWQRYSFDVHQEARKTGDRFYKVDRADIFKYYHSSGYCQSLARSPLLFCISILVVVLNAIYIGIDVEHNKAKRIFDAGAEFQIPQHFFCTYFLFEVMIRFGAFQQKTKCAMDSWFCFDAALALLLVFETWLLPLILLGQEDDSGADRTAGRMALLRLARLLRLTQLFRVFQFGELMTLVKGLVAATRSVVSTLLLLLMFIYVFAIIFRVLTEDYVDELPTHFSSLGGCMQLLLLQGTFVDDVTEVLDVVYPVSPLVYFLFITFIFLAAFAVLNLLIGILCDVVYRVRQTEESQALAATLRSSLFEILELHDKDGDRLIASEEWDLLMQNPEMHLILRRCHVNIKFLQDYKEVLFHNDSESKLNANATQDFDKLEAIKTGVPFEEMLEIILRLRGSTTATVSDIVDLRAYIQQRLDNLHAKLRKRDKEKFKFGGDRPEPMNSTGLFFGDATLDTSMFLQPDMTGPTIPALSRVRSDTSSDVPSWVMEIFRRLDNLSSKHDLLHREVADLRGNLRLCGLQLPDSGIGPAQAGQLSRPNSSASGSRPIMPGIPRLAVPRVDGMADLGGVQALAQPVTGVSGTDEEEFPGSGPASSAKEEERGRVPATTAADAAAALDAEAAFGAVATLQLKQQQLSPNQQQLPNSNVSSDTAESV